MAPPRLTAPPDPAWPSWTYGADEYGVGSTGQGIEAGLCCGCRPRPLPAGHPDNPGTYGCDLTLTAQPLDVLCVCAQGVLGAGGG